MSIERLPKKTGYEVMSMDTQEFTSFVEEYREKDRSALEITFRDLKQLITRLGAGDDEANTIAKDLIPRPSNSAYLIEQAKQIVSDRITYISGVLEEK